MLATTGTALVAGLAGCSGGDGGDGGDGADDGGGSSDIEVPAEAESRAEDYLTANPTADNYDGITAMGSGSVTVDVGARGNGGRFAYAPAAIVVESGTTVQWDWVAGNHNVLAAEGSDFDLDSGSARRDDSYEFTFDSTGVGTYYCTPHQSIGMKGAVIVVG